MILVTGSTGTIGRSLVPDLVARGPVRALVRDAAGAAAVESAGAQPAVGSFDDAESLRTALAGVSTLFLLSPAGDEDMARAQTRVVDLAAEAGVRRVVKLSSIGADEPTDARIVRAHRAIEERIEASGMRWTHLRPHWFMDNELGQAEGIAQAGALYAPHVGRVAMVDSRDVAAVAAEVLTSEGHDGRAYVLTGPEALTYREVAATLSEVLGQDVGWFEVSLDEARASMLEAGLPDSLATGFAEIMGGYRRGGVYARVSPDVETLTGRPPRSFAAFVGDHREAFAAREAVSA